MAKKKLTDIAAREFADEDSFLTQDASQQGVVDSDLSRPARVDSQHELAANEPQSDGAKTVDEALDVRRTVARKRS
jgi:hypothetical protein